MQTKATTTKGKRKNLATAIIAGFALWFTLAVFFYSMNHPWTVIPVYLVPIAVGVGLYRNLED